MGTPPTPQPDSRDPTADQPRSPATAGPGRTLHATPTSDHSADPTPDIEARGRAAEHLPGSDDHGRTRGHTAEERQATHGHSHRAPEPEAANRHDEVAEHEPHEESRGQEPSSTDQTPEHDAGQGDGVREPSPEQIDVSPEAGDEDDESSHHADGEDEQNTGRDEAGQPPQEQVGEGPDGDSDDHGETAEHQPDDEARDHGAGRDDEAPKLDAGRDDGDPGRPQEQVGEGSESDAEGDGEVEEEALLIVGGFWELARNIDRVERDRVGPDAAEPDVDDSPGAGQARRGEVDSGDEAAGRPGGFWDLAKKGVAAWGHEPSVDEMVDYWRGLIDDLRNAELDDLPPIGLLPALPPATTGPDQPAPAAAPDRLPELAPLPLRPPAPHADLGPDADSPAHHGGPHEEGPDDHAAPAWQPPSPGHHSDPALQPRLSEHPTRPAEALPATDHHAGPTLPPPSPGRHTDPARQPPFLEPHTGASLPAPAPGRHADPALPPPVHHADPAVQPHFSQHLARPAEALPATDHHARPALPPSPSGHRSDPAMQPPFLEHHPGAALPALAPGPHAEPAAPPHSSDDHDDPVAPPPSGERGGFLERRRADADLPGPRVVVGGAAELWEVDDGDDLEDTIETDTIDLEDTIELDELVELAGLADMAVLTDLANATQTTGADGPEAPDGAARVVEDLTAAPGRRGDAPPPAAAGTNRGGQAPDPGGRAHVSGDRAGGRGGEAQDRGDRAGRRAGHQPDPSDPGSDPGHAAGAAHEDGPGRPLGLAGGGLAFAGCLGLVDRRRRAQQRHRPTGRQIAMPAVPLDAYERELRHGADRPAAGLVDVALRAAAAGSADQTLPPLRWVEASSEAVTLVLDTARPAPLAAAVPPAPPGFAPAGETGWTTAGTPEELTELAAPVLPPIRALVPLGTTAEGHDLLVDLESTGLVTVGGPADDVLGLLRAATVSLGTAPWCEPLEVIVVGLEPELDVLPGVRAVADLGAALALAEAHADRVGERSRQTLVIVSAVAPEDDDLRNRVAALGRRPGRGVGLLLRHPSARPAGDVLSGLDVDTCRLDIDENGILRASHTSTTATATSTSTEQHGDGRPGTDISDDIVSDDIGSDKGGPLDIGGDLGVRARRLDAVEATALVALLDIAHHRDAHGPALGRGLDVRRPLRSAADAAPAATGRGYGLDELMAGVDVVVHVLGEVEAVRVGTEPARPLEPPSPEALEVITFLALAASPVSYGSLQVNLCVEGADVAGTIDEAIDAARQLLGDELLPPPTRGRYTLSDRVVTDYGVLCTLLAQADASDDPQRATELLATAVELVRGAPLGGDGLGYAWAGPQREAMVARVVDLAERLAERCLATHDWQAAAWAARQGLRALPCDERLHRALMRSARGSGDTDLVHQRFEDLCDAIADPDTGVEPDDTLHPETVELLETLVARRPRHLEGTSDQAPDDATGEAGDDHLAA